MLTTFSFKEQSPKGSSLRSDTTVKCALAIDARSTLKKEREKQQYLLKMNFEAFCGNMLKGKRDAAKLFFKIAEAYILMEEYNLDI